MDGFLPRRARLTSGQLSTYFYGYRELMKLRDAAEKTPGFQERAYNDRLVSHGSPPIKELRWLLGRAGPASPDPPPKH